MSEVLVLLLMSLAGGVGAMLRHLVDMNVKARLRASFPLGILLVNLSGSFALGLLVGLAAGHTVSLVIGTGLLGGYTTFSTASVDGVRLLQQRRWWPALLNGPGMLLACTGLAVLGILLARVGS